MTGSVPTSNSSEQQLDDPNSVQENGLPLHQHQDGKEQIDSLPSEKDGGVKEKEMVVKVEFTGGLEILFSNITSHKITLPTAVVTSTKNASLTTPTHSPPTISYLITYLVQNLMKDPRKELFVLEDEAGDGRYSIRPGILVLINDADWELEGEEGYVLKEGDEVLFVSTLHGG